MATRQQAHGCSAPAIGPRGPHARRGLSTKPRCMTKATVTSRYRWHVSQNLTRGASCGSRNFGVRYVSLDKTHTRRVSPVRDARRGCCAAAVPLPRPSLLLSSGARAAARWREAVRSRGDGCCAAAVPPPRLAASQQRCSSRGAMARSRAFPRRWLLRGGSAAAAPRCFPAAVLEPQCWYGAVLVCGDGCCAAVVSL